MRKGIEFLGLVGVLACGSDATKPPDVNVRPSTIRVRPGPAVVPVGLQFQETAFVLSAGGLTLNGQSPIWHSDNEQVARIDAGGVVTAAGAGQARITASLSGIELHSNVTVLQWSCGDAPELSDFESFDGRPIHGFPIDAAPPDGIIDDSDKYVECYDDWPSLVPVVSTYAKFTVPIAATERTRSFFLAYLASHGYSNVSSNFDVDAREFHIDATKGEQKYPHLGIQLYTGEVFVYYDYKLGG